MDDVNEKKPSVPAALRIPFTVVIALVAAKIALILIGFLGLISFLKPISGILAVISLVLAIFVGIVTFQKLNTYLMKI